MALACYACCAVLLPSPVFVRKYSGGVPEVAALLCAMPCRAVLCFTLLWRMFAHTAVLLFSL